MEIKKIGNSDFVMFPRLQRPGLKPKLVECETYKAELKHVEGHGDYWLLYQQPKPHLVVHVRVLDRIRGVTTLRGTYLLSV